MVGAFFSVMRLSPVFLFYFDEIGDASVKNCFEIGGVM